jgi:hypothetical protein
MALSSRATATQIWASNAGAREVRRLPVPSLRRHRARREPLRGAAEPNAGRQIHHHLNYSRHSVWFDSWIDAAINILLSSIFYN